MLYRLQLVSDLNIKVKILAEMKLWQVSYYLSGTSILCSVVDEVQLQPLLNIFQVCL